MYYILLLLTIISFTVNAERSDILDIGGQNQQLPSSVQTMFSIADEYNNISMEGGISGAGNGGVGIVCPREKRVLLRDLFEANFDPTFKLTVVRKKEASMFQLNKAMERIKSFNEMLYFFIWRELNTIRENYYFQKNVGLEITDDIEAAIYKKGCQDQTIVQYKYDFNGEASIVIDKNLYKRLPRTDQAALWIHEAIYSLSRKSSLTPVENSYLVRYLTAQIFAQKKNKKRFMSVARMAFSPLVLLEKTKANLIDIIVHQCLRSDYYDCREYVKVIDRYKVEKSMLLIDTHTDYTYTYRKVISYPVNNDVSNFLDSIYTWPKLLSPKIKIIRPEYLENDLAITVSLGVKGKTDNLFFSNYLLNRSAEYIAGIEEKIYLLPASANEEKETIVNIHYLFI